MNGKTVVFTSAAVGAFAVVGISGALGQVYQDVGAYGGNLAPSTATDNTLRASPLSRSQSWNNSALGTIGSSSASAWAQYGVLRASAHAENAASDGDTPNAMYPNGAAAGARASFTDTITINASNPLLQGTAGSFTASIDFNGTLSAGFLGSNVSFDNHEEAPPTIQASLIVRNGFTQVFSDYADLALQYGPGAWTATGGVSGPRSFTLNFIFGQPLVLNVELTATASPTSSGASSAQSVYAHVDFGNSATWNGISQVVANGGTVLGSADYSLGSASGTNYTSAIPAPGAAALFGLGGVMVARRRR